MKLYYRTITKREIINRFGKLGFVPYLQMVKTDDITPFNKGKRIKYKEINTLYGLYGVLESYVYNYMQDKDINKIYEIKESEI